MRLEPEDLLGEVASTALEHQGRRVRRGGCGETCRDGAATEAVDHQPRWIGPVGYDVAEGYAHRCLGPRACIVSRPGRTPIAGLRYRGGEKAALVPPLKDTACRRGPSTRSLAELMAMNNDYARPRWCPVWTAQENLNGLSLLAADQGLLNVQSRHVPLPRHCSQLAPAIGRRAPATARRRRSRRRDHKSRSRRIGRQSHAPPPPG